MDVRQLSLDPLYSSYQSIRFAITNTIPAFVNSLRRIILADVPTIAIEEIIMVENNTAMFDEYIAHRLGLIPLNSDEVVEELNFQTSCEVCEGVGCDQCTVTLTLTEETDLATERVVKSSDLIPSDHRVYPVVDNIPIMKMGRDQRLILEAVARLGSGSQHAKWQPTSSLGFQYMPNIEIHPGSKFTKEVSDACPRNVLEFDEKNQSITINDLLGCNLCMECVETAEDGAIEVTGDQNQIIFMLESTGALPVENIVIKAADILKEKAEMFITNFQEALEIAENDPSIAKKISSFERIPLDQKNYEHFG